MGLCCDGVCKDDLFSHCLHLSGVCSGYFLCIKAIFLVKNTSISWVINSFWDYMHFSVLWMLTSCTNNKLYCLRLIDSYYTMLFVYFLSSSCSHEARCFCERCCLQPALTGYSTR